MSTVIQTIELNKPRFSKDRKTRYYSLKDKSYFPFTNVIAFSKAKVTNENSYAQICFKRKTESPLYSEEQKQTIYTSTDTFINQLENINDMFKSIWAPQIMKHLKLKDVNVYEIKQTKITVDGEEKDLEEPLYRVRMTKNSYMNIKTKKEVTCEMKDISNHITRHSLLGGTFSVNAIVVSKAGVSIQVCFNSLAVMKHPNNKHEEDYSEMFDLADNLSPEFNDEPTD